MKGHTLCAGIRVLFFTIAAAVLLAPVASAQTPEVSNVNVELDGTMATITYDLSGGTADITVLFSKDGGANFDFDAPSATGDLGPEITVGTGKTITWDIALDYAAECIPQARVRIVPSGGGPDIEMPMVSVPAGSFEMGDTFGEGISHELPVHTVTLSAYEIGVYEVTNAQVAAVYNWANGQGLIDTVNATTVTHNGQQLLDLDARYIQISYNGGSGALEVETRQSLSMADHPVVEISWYGAVAFCNWLSQLEGRTPVYDLSAWSRVNPAGGGYRLPTEAEWERAAGWDAAGARKWRYGTSSDSISCATANYRESDNCNPLVLTDFPYTSPVGYYAGVTSPVGCYDMSGNVWEWCEDWYSGSFYGSSPTQDPINSTRSAGRVLRGGAWPFVAGTLRSANRDSNPPGNTLDGYYFGLRVVRGSGSR